MTSYITQQQRAVLPKHPQYSVENVRLSSYSKWPPTSTQIPVALCDAGFFYAGFSDCVRCFFCGGGLRNWEDGDIAWIEHARWYPDCDYLRQRKGELFIQMHRQDYSQQNQEVQRPSLNDRVSMEAAVNQWQSREHQNTEESNVENTERRRTAIRSVVEMGYSQSVVQACVDRLVERGKSTFTARDIMEIIFENEESNEAGNSTQSAQIPDRHIFQPEKQEPLRNTERQFTKTTETSQNSTTSVDCRSLVKENQDLREQMICKICLDRDACIVYLPCGHMVTCETCAPTIRKCCICRKLIEGTVRAYM